MHIRFYYDREFGVPHIYEHGVSEDEVYDVITQASEDVPARDGARIARGQTRGGRYLKVIYTRDPEPRSIFVITAYEMSPKELKAYRSRKRKKQP